MIKSKKERKQESGSPLESLRLEFTELTQDEFIVQCGFARATYQRWGKSTSVKPTPEQIAAVCRTCKISLPTLFRRLGVDISGIPDDKPPKRTGSSSPGE